MTDAVSSDAIGCEAGAIRAPAHCAPAAPALLAARLILAGAIVGFFVWQSFYDHAADFKSFYSAGYAVRHPEIPLYDLVALDENPFGEVFKLPPPAAVYLVPASFGTIQQARLAWRLVLVAAFVGAFAVLAAGFGIPPLSAAWLAGLGAWSLLGPLQIAVGEGQWDPIFLLLVALATVGVADGRPLLAALPIALAASVKPYPLFLAGYFLARGWWRALAVMMATLALLLAAGSLVVGLDETRAFVTRVLPASGATTAYPDNQALGGVLARLVTTDLKPVPLQDAPALDLAIRVAALALGAFTCWLVYRRRPTDRFERALQLSLFVPLAVFAIPAAWSHYQAILLVPLTLLALDQWRHRQRSLAGWVLVAAIYLPLLLPNPSLLYGPEIDRDLWLRSRADSANLALERLYPTVLSRLVLSYKALGTTLLYVVLAWRIGQAPKSTDATDRTLGALARRLA